MWHDVLVAIALVLVLEGLMPFASPGTWRRAILAATELNDATIRFIGLTSMLGGLVLLYAVN
jgi:hypothetical protein